MLSFGARTFPTTAHLVAYFISIVLVANIATDGQMAVFGHTLISATWSLFQVEIPAPATVQVLATPCVAPLASPVSTFGLPAPSPLPAPQLLLSGLAQPVSVPSPVVESSQAKRFLLLALLVGWVYLCVPVNILTFLAGWDAHDSDEAFHKSTTTRPPSEEFDTAEDCDTADDFDTADDLDTTNDLDTTDDFDLEALQVLDAAEFELELEIALAESADRLHQQPKSSRKSGRKSGRKSSRKTKQKCESLGGRGGPHGVAQAGLEPFAEVDEAEDDSVAAWKAQDRSISWADE